MGLFRNDGHMDLVIKAIDDQIIRSLSASGSPFYNAEIAPELLDILGEVDAENKSGSRPKAEVDEMNMGTDGTYMEAAGDDDRRGRADHEGDCC